MPQGARRETHRTHRIVTFASGERLARSQRWKTSRGGAGWPRLGQLHGFEPEARGAPLLLQFAPMRNLSIAACLVISSFAAIVSEVACAHEFWLAPSTYRAAPIDTVTIRAFVGDGFRGEPRPFATTRTVQFTMHGARRTDLTPGVTNGELRWALFIPPDAGGQLLSYQSNFISIELPADRFDAYLEAEGLEGPLMARRRLGSKAGPGRERYARCAKTWIAGENARRSMRPLGLPLEIVPLADPESSPRLSVRVLFQGKPLRHALVRTWNRELRHAAMPFDPATRDSVAPAQALRTAQDGTVTLDVRRGGEWLVSVVHMTPSESPREADWESLWASFTFARRSRRR